MAFKSKVMFHYLCPRKMQLGNMGSSNEEIITSKLKQISFFKTWDYITVEKGGHQNIHRITLIIRLKSGIFTTTTLPLSNPLKAHPCTCKGSLLADTKQAREASRRTFIFKKFIFLLDCKTRVF